MTTSISTLDRDTLLAILENVPSSIFVKDEKLRFVFCNRQNRRLINKEEHELYGFTDADFYVADQAKIFIADDQKVIDTGQALKIEEMASRKDGMTLPVLTRKEKMETADGKVYLIGTNTDLTEIKKREEQYRALAETVPVGVLQIEEHGAVSFANPLLLAYFHREADSLTRENICEILGRDAATFPGQASRFEYTLVHSDGSERRVLVISSGWLALTKGRNRSALVSVVDVSENTELKRINEEILRLNQELAINMQQLKDAQDALVKKGRMEQMGQLTATIAHELRNPLGAVRTSAFLIERKLKDKGLGIESQMSRINNGVMRCDNIITQLLDFSRSKQLVCEAADMDEWLATLVEEEAKRLPEIVQINCILGLDGIKVPFDASRLQRAVVNLISNAAEAMVGNGEAKLTDSANTPCIEISTEIHNDFVCLSVKDNGPGISAELIDKIREPLFTTKSFGTGLGIPAIEQIASQHGGRLEIISQAGQGAAFILHLPLNATHTEAA
jgi:PAS domain S-box-containing protein